MSVLGFAHYNLRGSRVQIEALREFYTEVVGLTVGERPPFRSFGYWLYAGGRDLLHLSEARPGEPERADAPTTFDHVALRSTGLPATEQHLRARGIDYRRAEVPETGAQQLFFRDPFGNGVELNFAPEDQ